VRVVPEAASTNAGRDPAKPPMEFGSEREEKRCVNIEVLTIGTDGTGEV
jgi:hypothetical protein